MTAPRAREVFEFGPFRLEPHEARLTRGGEPVALTPKGLDLLLLLVRNAGRLVTRDEVMETLWPDTIVSDGNLKQNVWALRKALEAAGGEECIQTVPRAGYRFAAAVKRTDAAPPASARGTAVPAPLTSLVGRTREVESLEALLARPDVRLVTLTGPGGTGKTRLALEVARGALERADRAVFVPLASIADPALFLPTLAQALGVEEDLFRPLAELIEQHLRAYAGTTLLVLDNFEHLLPAASALTAILAAAPRVKAIVTSRFLLRVSSEHDFPVPPLAVPDLRARPTLAELHGSDAVTLFVERARAQRPDFALTDANARAVAEICVRLDGLPLAIELAAVRVRILAPELLLAQLGNRLGALSTGPRDVSERQRTLRGAIAWSHDLLPADESALFRRLSVFAGSFTAEAAGAVAPSALDPLRGLESLSEKSLVVAGAGDAGPRFSLLETLREYAAERLEESGETADARARHAAHFRSFARAQAPGIESEEQRRVLDALEMSHDDLRAALRFFDGNDPPAFLETATALGAFWHLKGHWEEALASLDRGLTAAPDAPPLLRATALLHMGRLSFFLGAEEEARRRLDEALRLARPTGDAGIVSRILEALAQAHLKVGEDARAMEALEEARRLATEAGDGGALAEVLTTLGAAHAGTGEIAAAEAELAEGLARGRALGNGSLVGRALYYLGGLALLRGDLAAVERNALDAEAHAARSGDTSWSSHMTEMRGRALAAAGRFVESAALIRSSLVSLQEVGSHACLPHSLEAVARLALARAGASGDGADAVRFLAAAERSCESMSVAMLPVERALFAQSVAEARRSVRGEAFETAWREGKSWDPKAAAERAAAACEAVSSGLTEL